MNKVITLKRKKDFNETIKEGKKVISKKYVIYYKENNVIKNSKIGIAVSKKIQKLAVNRNKTKRQIRNMLNEYSLTKKNFLIVIIVRPNYFMDTNFSDNKKELLNNLKNIN